ncbi:tetratricopeptide repeat protein [Geomonas subterranea]|uniref:Tetratricopeptide repeat protein n=1 Tax=Geomonas subterranea TaxID=2847989 RepID=A0ABX8LPG4_9BACT|nr:tetratricopeptide repeat protein [Geomonas subterranea]QXE92199.1 tetratricopeptide repeat protein [Geomonas subterranea]QXM09702.1 tetratricopeptide repeat protein [Geomonas subterranea]
MEPVPQEDAEKLFHRALTAFSAGEYQAALAQLERALKLEDNPLLHSYLGLCIAKERGQVKKGRELCQASLDLEPDNPVHYLNLARVYQVAGDKPQALDVLRKGMAAGGSEEILALLATLGTRKPPPLRFLSRDHVLNKWLGIALSRFGLR